MSPRVECPAGCHRLVAPGQLMCGPCWGEVPAHLKRAVNRAWQTQRQFGVFADSREAQKARAAYRAARDEAIGAIR